MTYMPWHRANASPIFRISLTSKVRAYASLSWRHNDTVHTTPRCFIMHHALVKGLLSLKLARNCLVEKTINVHPRFHNYTIGSLKNHENMRFAIFSGAPNMLPHNSIPMCNAPKHRKEAIASRAFGPVALGQKSFTS